MTKNTKTIIGVGVGVLLLLWLRNRNKSADTLKSEEAGAEGSGGGGSITPNALGGATTILPVSTIAVGSTQPVNVTKPLFNMPSTSVAKPMVNPISNAKPMVSPVRKPSLATNTSFARFDGSFRSPSGLDFDGHIEN